MLNNYPVNENFINPNLLILELFKSNLEPNNVRKKLGVLVYAQIDLVVNTFIITTAILEFKTKDTKKTFFFV